MLRRTSLVAACREAGLATRWLSNQAPTGRWDELVASYAHEADAVQWMNPAPLISEWGRVTVYDDKLLAAAAETIDGLPERALVVLHMQGSHMRYELRYRPEEAVFQPAAQPGSGEDYRAEPERMRNAYDNSVAMTDALVDACIELHRRSGRTGFVMFLADHGESLLDGADGFQGHGNLPPPEVELRIPWLVWPSPAERARHPATWAAAAANRGRPASARDLFPTLLHLAGITVRDGDPGRSLGCPDYRERARQLIDSWGRPLDFDRDVLARRR
jgi:heptose-I-phosphate ethanolaminephosphotransferase